MEKEKFNRTRPSTNTIKNIDGNQTQSKCINHLSNSYKKLQKTIDFNFNVVDVDEEQILEQILETYPDFKDEEISKIKKDERFKKIYSNLKNKYNNESMQSLQKDPQFLEIYNKLMKADPTDKKKYCIWIINQFLNKEFTLDSDELKEVANNMNKYLLLTGKGQSKNVPVLDATFSYSKLKEYLEKESEKAIINLRKPLKQTEKEDIYYDGIYGTLVSPKTQKASCEWGKGTKWCTAAASNNMFKHYTEFGKLYIWKDKKKDDKKYQFSFPNLDIKVAKRDIPESSSVDGKNEVDDDINPDILFYLRNENVVMKQFFEQKEQEMLEYFDKIVKQNDYDYVKLKRILSIIINYEKLIKPQIWEYAKQIKERIIKEVIPNIIESITLQKLVDLSIDIDYRLPPEFEDNFFKDDNLLDDTILNYWIKFFNGKRWKEFEDYMLYSELYVNMTEYILLLDEKQKWNKGEKEVLKHIVDDFKSLKIDSNFQFQFNIISKYNIDYLDNILMYTLFPLYKQMFDDNNIDLAKRLKLTAFMVSNSKKLNKRHIELEYFILKFLDKEIDNLSFSNYYSIFWIFNDYSIHVGRWKDYENLILNKKKIDLILDYINGYLKKEWPTAEKIILQGVINPNLIQDIISYAIDYKKGRWIELENQLLLFFSDINNQESFQYYLQFIKDYIKDPNFYKQINQVISDIVK
jgi:hypothetical protein